VSFLGNTSVDCSQLINKNESKKKRDLMRFIKTFL
jgi:hypothetical protein